MKIASDLVAQIFAYGESRQKYSLISATCRKLCHSYTYIISLKSYDVMKVFVECIINVDGDGLRHCLASREFHRYPYHIPMGVPFGLLARRDYDCNGHYLDDGKFVRLHLQQLPRYFMVVIDGAEKRFEIFEPEIIRILILDDKLAKFYPRTVWEAMIEDYVKPIPLTMENFDIEKFHIEQIHRLSDENVTDFRQVSVMVGDIESIIQKTNIAIRAFYYENPENCCRLLVLMGIIGQGGKSKMDAQADAWRILAEKMPNKK